MPPQGDDFPRWSKSNAGEAAERWANDDPNDHAGHLSRTRIRPSGDTGDRRMRMRQQQ
jgi:hypothetical protein